MVDWGLAKQIARFAAGAGGPAVEADFPALVAESEEHLRGYTQLELSEPVPPPEAVDRATWAGGKPGSMGKLLEPGDERLAKRLERGGAVAGPRCHRGRAA